MQYLLTEDEYKELQLLASKQRAAAAAELQSLCTQVATFKPVLFWDHDKPEPWGCILNEGDDDTNHGYCDECPVQKQCPNDAKRWSQ